MASSTSRQREVHALIRNVSVAVIVALVLGMVLWFLTVRPAQQKGAAMDAIAADVKSGRASNDDFFAASEVSTPNAVRPNVAFLGDSYTQGTGTDNVSKAFVMVASKELGWKGRQFAVGGTGYSGPAGKSFGERLDAVIEAEPDIVVVSGSRNDSGNGAARMRALADDVFSRIREELPDAELIVVGPMWTSDDVPRDIEVLNAGVRKAAEDNDAVFLDALSPSWLDGSEELISDDGVHPSEEGHAVLAEKFVAAVEAARD